MKTKMKLRGPRGPYKRTRLVHGVGINDADYTVSHRVGGIIIWQCPFNKVWNEMLRRAYSKQKHIVHPSYIGTLVCKEWFYFMTFRTWMETQNWQGLELDKDIIKSGNKTYCPDYCCFVTHRINSLIVYRQRGRGDLPLGVLQSSPNRFKARCPTISGEGRKSLGCYDTPEEAFEVYCKAKSDLIIGEARNIKELRVREGLYRHAYLYREGLIT